MSSGSVTLSSGPLEHGLGSEEGSRVGAVPPLLQCPPQQGASGPRTSQTLLTQRTADTLRSPYGLSVPYPPSNTHRLINQLTMHFCPQVLPFGQTEANKRGLV